uniref:Uncharacterized protein n=1 Tax=Triticum urartu TaxID=4572 RepID=A0A8R7QUU4_TRIUA
MRGRIWRGDAVDGELSGVACQVRRERRDSGEKLGVGYAACAGGLTFFKRYLHREI